jgi:hypothetical protein
MNDRDPRLFEAELVRLKPAQPPEEFLDRLAAMRPVSPAPREARSRLVPPPAAWWWRLRWWASATAAAAIAVVVILLVWRWPVSTSKPINPSATVSPPRAVKSEDIEIDQRLIATFDAVARMPSGEPVRFRCREWTDEVVLRDSVRGVVIERQTPRLEIVPVSFETY